MAILNKTKLAIALAIPALLLAVFAIACGTETVVETVVIEREVQVEVAVPQTVVVEKQVQVAGETVVQTVVVEKEVEVAGETVVQTVVVEKEVVVEGETVVQTVVVETERIVEVEKQVVQTVVVKESVQVEVEAPRRSGGEITIGTVYVPPPLYLPSAQPSPEYWKVHAWGITETLLRTDRELPPPDLGTPGTSGLATAWSMDGDSISFTVRDGSYFSGMGQNWGPLTAEDVAFSFTNTGQEGSRAARAGSFNDANRRGIWNCAAIDSNNLSCDMDSSRLSPDFLYWISNENGLTSISSKNVFDTLGEAQAILTPHGSGPWEVIKQVGNDELVATAKLDHWRAPPLADTLRIVEIREASQAAAALITGDIDLAQIPNSLVINTENRSRGRRVQVTGGLPQSIYFGGNFWTDQNYDNDEAIEPRPGHRPDDDHPWIGTGPDDENANTVRRALAYAINREVINATILGGLGRAFWTEVGYEPDTPFWQDGWLNEYNPEMARQMLADAGYPNGFTMGFWVPPDSPFVNPEVGVAVAGQWRDVGIDVKITSEAYSARRPKLVSREMDIPWIFVNQGRPPHTGVKYGRFNANPGWNSGIELPYATMKDWDSRYSGLNPDADAELIYALNTEIENYMQRTGLATGIVELVKWWVTGPEILKWDAHRHNENAPNSFEAILLDN